MSQFQNAKLMSMPEAGIIGVEHKISMQTIQNMVADWAFWPSRYIFASADRGQRWTDLSIFFACTAKWRKELIGIGYLNLVFNFK